MLRPERMSRVSVTGARRVRDDVVDAVHDLELLHITEYDGSWEGFELGNPSEGADEDSDKLVTVRSLLSILDVDESDAGPTRRIDDEALDAELAEIRDEVNELDDRRDEISDELRTVEDRIDRMEPFVSLGLDVDLLSGYDSLAVSVGEGEAEAIESALDAADIEQYELYTGEDVVAVFAYTDEGTLQDALVDARFTGIETPEIGAESEATVEDTSPAAHLKQLERRQDELESKLETVETELEEMRHSVGGFLLAAEEQLAIDVQKDEAPLTFATTENAFIAEGWIPTERYDAFESELRAAVGDAVDIDEMERAEFTGRGHETHEPHEGTGGEPADAQAAAATAQKRAQSSDQPETAADGGTVTMGDDQPPTVQDNSGPVKPFEALVEVINRPKYGELDPTIILFLTFPAFFGFMIGDVGYGIAYTLIGYVIMTRVDSDVLKSLGGIAVWAGGFTTLFGVLYGEIFGLHLVTEYVWVPLMGAPPIHKGLQPHYLYYAQGWLLLSVVVGLAHLVTGWLFDFRANLEHGFVAAMFESGAWIISTVGMWLWILSTSLITYKPPFLFEVFGQVGMTNPANGEVIEHVALPLGFTGFSPTVGTIGIAMLVIGMVMLIYEEGPAIALIETITQSFGHVVSYTRIAAVLLAKAGMALAVNLLVFGAYSYEGEFHFIFFEGMPEAGHGEVIFAGLFNLGGAVGLVAGILMGILILLLGHLLVLVLGITSAGLQAVRLEYVEFFGKFYEGGGIVYNPFGYERSYTTDE